MTQPVERDLQVDLALAAEEDRTSYAFTLVPRAADVGDYLAAQFARTARGLTPFAQIRLSDDAPVGCTAYWNPRAWPDREDLCAVNIGWTWLAASAQRTGINREAKLLLLAHAFEVLGVARVDWKTDARNERSRRAIERIGDNAVDIGEQVAFVITGLFREFSDSSHPFAWRRPAPQA